MMKNQVCIAFMTLTLLGGFLYPVIAQKPNVLIILADDLGFSDIGCYGGEINTPNLDGLAEQGIRFTQFYNTARCWPTRAALLTGYYAQQVRRDVIPGVIPRGGAGNRPQWARLLPKMLKTQGYRSYHSGKWHIDGKPVENGFDRSYWMADHGRFFNPKKLFEDDQPLPAVEPGTDYYVTTAIADHAIDCLKDHQQNHSDRPFFHFLAFTSPHFPLHARPEDIDRYRDLYKKDWEILRQERWERLNHLGIISGELSNVERELGPPYDFPDALETLGPNEVNRPLSWDELTPGQREFQSIKMAIHAAMVDRMDRDIGRVLDQLREMNAFDNTLIFFFSDNGASAEIMVRDDGHDPNASPGSAPTYLCLGPGGSTNSNTPFRRHKTWVHEGGISTPLIAHWPSGITERGTLRHNPGHVIDLVPTILEVTGTSRDGEAPPLPGYSLTPVFGSDNSVMRQDIWWYHEGNRALRQGDWKIVSAAKEFSFDPQTKELTIVDGPWELYNLGTDRAESNDLADKNLEKIQEMERIWAERMDEFRKLAIQDQSAYDE